jgi:beta-lactamase class A
MGQGRRSTNAREGRAASGAAAAVLAALCLVTNALAAQANSPVSPRLDRTSLGRRIAAIASAARPARLGVGVKDLTSGDTFFLDGDRLLPMQSVFKAPLGAMVLDRAAQGRLRLDSMLVLTAADLSPSYSPVRDSFPERNRYTVEELLERAVGTSDNTAADVLLGLAGGPAALTRWLRDRGIGGIRVDRPERVLQCETSGLPPFRPEWSSDAAWRAARDSVPAEVRRRAIREYLAGKRDALTPKGAVSFLESLATGKLMGPEPTARLLRIMTESPTGANRIKAGLPPDAGLAHKTGTGYTDFGVNAAANDIGIVTLAGGRRVILAVLLSGSTAPEAERDAVHAAVARAVVEALR